MSADRHTHRFILLSIDFLKPLIFSRAIHLSHRDSK